MAKDEAGARDTATIEKRKKAKADAFKKALTTLATDKDYRDRAQKEPELIIKDFPDLGIGELRALRQAAVMSGADVSAVDNDLWDQMHIPPDWLEPVHPHEPGSSETGGVHIHCCCCCCCCGETAIAAVP